MTPPRGSDRHDRSDEPGSRARKPASAPEESGGRRRKPNLLEQLKVKTVSHKDVSTLKYFVTESGKLLPRRQTGVTAKQQRAVTKAVKRARMLALLPYSAKAPG
jgi:small subunit ribosomal protein S18